jgi:hypothetical protein
MLSWASAGAKNSEFVCEVHTMILLLFIDRWMPNLRMRGCPWPTWSSPEQVMLLFAQHHSRLYVILQTTICNMHTHALSTIQILGQMSFWSNVFWSNKCLSGQMSFWANVFLGRFIIGNRHMGKCLSWQISSGQMSYGEMSFWANVSGQTALGMCRRGKRRITPVNILFSIGTNKSSLDPE